MLYILIYSLILFTILIFMQLINAIFKIYKILLKKLYSKGGFYFPIYAGVD